MDIAERLRRELGTEFVLARGDDAIEDYGRDESGLGPYPPDAVALCQSTEHVLSTLALCRESGVPVTPRGVGSGKVGGCLPIRGGVVLSTEAMAGIREMDSSDLICIAGAGTVTGTIQAQAESQELFYPPDPASLDYCSIGGNVVCNAGGPRAFKYGVTREYVLGLQVVLSNGDVLDMGRRTSKGVTGYDLVASFVGSEGTLGVVTEVTLKLLPRPRARIAALAVFPSLQDASLAIEDLLHRGFRPCALELMDQSAIDHVRPLVSGVFAPDTQAAALIEIDGEPEGLEATLIAIGNICESHSAVDVHVATDEASRTRLWQARRKVSSALTQAHRFKVSEDICVPRGRMAEMVRRIEALSKRHALQSACYGHAGDGNLHVNFLIDDDPGDPMTKRSVESAVRELFQETVELGGTLSGEHGIGLTKRDYMPLEQNEALLSWQRKLKKMWDPSGILNPGKVLPAAPRGCSE